jgi:hypothetical protein
MNFNFIFYFYSFLDSSQDFRVAMQITEDRMKAEIRRLIMERVEKCKRVNPQFAVDLQQLLDKIDEYFPYYPKRRSDNIPAYVSYSKYASECIANCSEPAERDVASLPENIVVEEDYQEVWKIGYNTEGKFLFPRLVQGVDIRAFEPEIFYEATAEQKEACKKERELLRDFQNDINQRKYLDSMFNRNIVICAPKVLINAFKLNTEYWPGANLVFSENDDMSIIMQPLNVSWLVEKIRLDSKEMVKPDCIVIIFPSLEFFDRRQPNLKKHMDKQSKTCATLVKSVVLENIAKEFDCAILFGGFMDLQHFNKLTPGPSVTQYCNRWNDQIEQSDKVTENRTSGGFRNRPNIGNSLLKAHYGNYHQHVCSINSVFVETRKRTPGCNSDCGSLRSSSLLCHTHQNGSVQFVNCTIMSEEYISNPKKSKQLFNRFGEPTFYHLTHTVAALYTATVAVVGGYFKNRAYFQKFLGSKSDERTMSVLTARKVEIERKFEITVRKLATPFDYSAYRQAAKLKSRKANSSAAQLIADTYGDLDSDAVEPLDNFVPLPSPARK